MFIVTSFNFACSQNHDFVLIINVHDGDTFTDAKNQQYRLFGVDTPEVSDQFNNFQKTKAIDGIFAEEAKVFVQNLIQNQKVKIQKITIDKFRRQVARILINNLDLGILIIKNGLGRVAYISADPQNYFFSTKRRYYEQLLKEQYLAFVNKKGIWTRKSDFAKIFPKA